MRFINPKTDLAFKKIFGSDASHGVLIDFLDSLLYGGLGAIADLEILNPWLAPKIRGVKDTYLDVRAKLADGRQVIIEMQVLNVEGFEKRILYNAAKAYSVQLPVGGDYAELAPVIALTLTDFVMFPGHAPYLSRFTLREREFLLDYPQHDLELVFVELPKFDAPLEALSGRAERWLYFIKHARDLTAVPAEFAGDATLRRAFELANAAQLSPEEEEDLEKREIFIHDQRNAILKATKQGFEQGALAEKLAIARNLLDLLDDATIAAKTGLAPEEVARLRQG